MNAVFGGDDADFARRSGSFVSKFMFPGFNQGINHSQQLGARERFRQERGRPRPFRAAFHPFTIKNRQNDNWYRLITRQVPDLQACLDPVHLRHAQIEQHKRRQGLGREFHRLHPIGTQQQRTTGFRQHRAQEAAHHRIVVRDDDCFIEGLDRQTGLPPFALRVRRDAILSRLMPYEAGGPMENLMSDTAFDVDAWLFRIGHHGSREPVLPTLRALIGAHTATIPFENIDVLLGQPPKLDLGSLQRKMIANGRGGYCFEQNTLFLAGLLALGFRVTGLLARVIRGMDAGASGPATHMMLRVDLPEGPFLADVGFGNLTPTAPLVLRPGVEQETPHEIMRLWPVGEELTLQARHGEAWQNIYRLSPHPRLDIDFEVANWFAATHPASPFVNHLIVARPGRDGMRSTLFNGRITVRRRGDLVDRFKLDGGTDFQAVLESRFGLVLSGPDVGEALELLDRKGTRGATHPFFG